MVLHPNIYKPQEIMVILNSLGQSDTITLFNLINIGTDNVLCQCWPSSMLPCGITRPQWVEVYHGGMSRLFQIVKNLVYLGKVLIQMPDHQMSSAANRNSTEDGEEGNWVSLTWLIKRLVRETRAEKANNVKMTIKVSFFSYSMWHCSVWWKGCIRI